MKKNNNHEKNLYAPQVDLLIFRAEKMNEVNDNLTQTIIDEFFQQIQAIAICGDDERREIWITAPRGSIEEFGNYEESLEDGEVENYEEYKELWLSEYPEPLKWYPLTTVVYKEIRSVFIGGKLVFQTNPEPQGQYPYDKSELANWIVDSTKKVIDLLKSGEYNEYVSKYLPNSKRIGKILREDYWRIFPEEKEEYLKNISLNEINRFANLIIKQPDKAPILRLKEITAGIFFECCRLGYEANQYEGIEKLSDKELYRKHADGRDEGLLNLDEVSSGDFESWYFDKTHYGGHPWEVCRGGNSTHISLYVMHDEEGWWLSLAGSSLGRSVETVKFYLALSEKGLPIFLYKGREILKMLTGKDYIGIVPEGVIPRYCDWMFPDEKLLSFMNLPWEERDEVEKATTWHTIKEVKLL